MSGEHTVTAPDNPLTVLGRGRGSSRSRFLRRAGRFLNPRRKRFWLVTVMCGAPAAMAAVLAILFLIPDLKPQDLKIAGWKFGEVDAWDQETGLRWDIGGGIDEPGGGGRKYGRSLRIGLLELRAERQIPGKGGGFLSFAGTSLPVTTNGMHWVPGGAFGRGIAVRSGEWDFSACGGGKPSSERRMLYKF